MVMTGAFSGRFKLVTAVGLSLALAGCEDGQGPSFDFLKKKDADSPAISSETPAADVKGVEREVEKPDVFSANESALWDGRPSLGGVWIAAPGVKDPERVIIRNSENGKSVVGALFRRERENPGPRLQLSSDAAVELGVLAGAPTKLSVVALRTETVVPTPAPVPIPVPTPEPAPEPVLAEAPAPALSPAPEPRTEAAIETAAIQTDGPADPLVAEPEPEPTGSPASSMPTFFNRGARKAQANASNGFDVAADTAATTATATTGAAVETASVTTQTLDPIKAAEAALERADAQIAQDPAVSPAVAASTPPRSNGALAKPYIQIGIFAVKSNADRAARRLNDAGVIPVVLKQQSAGRTIWRVIVGPARSKSDGNALQAKVRGMGYTDAYFVTD